VKFQTVPNDLSPTLLDTWDQSFRKLGEGARAVGNGFYALAEPTDGSGSDSTIQPQGPRFRGRVAVLTDAANSSATYGFARRVQAARLGTIVGGETGGNRRGINGGAYFFVRLPESGLEADLPLIGYFPPGRLPDRGVLPDVPVPVTLASIRAGGDPALDRALRVVRGLT
jgi:C-terminal processing protease CtpA/Prc